MTGERWRRRLLTIGGAVGLIVACHREASTSLPDYGRTPALFVHGHGLSSSTWTEAMAYLTSRGYPREYLHAVDILPSRMANVQAATTVLSPVVESLLARAAAAARTAGYPGEPPRRVDLVSHSMGAVSSRLYAARIHPERVRTWIALAGANHGTNALCRYSDEAAREMCPAFAGATDGSTVQVALNGTLGAPRDETPYGLGVDRVGVTSIPADRSRSILYFTVRIEPDPWITPARSAVLDGAGGVPVAVPSGVPVKETNPGNFLFYDAVDHDSLPRHPDLIRFLAALLAVRGR